jgi:hypothetical protein
MQRPRLSPALFALICISFLRPFATVSCDGAQTSFTGLELATWRVPAGGHVSESDCDADISSCVEPRLRLRRRGVGVRDCWAPAGAFRNCQGTRLVCLWRLCRNLGNRDPEFSAAWSDGDLPHRILVDPLAVRRLGVGTRSSSAATTKSCARRVSRAHP